MKFVKKPYWPWDLKGEGTINTIEKTKPNFKIKLVPATLEMLPIIQNMARFYAYDMSKSCGEDGIFRWEFPENGLYETLDLSKYWVPNSYPFLIRLN